MTRHYGFYERNGGVHGAETPRPLSLNALMSDHPHTLSPDDRVLDAMNLIRDQGVRHIPVVDPATGRLEGLITEVDILRHVLHGHAMTEEESYHATLDLMLPLREVMVREVQTLPREALVIEAVGMFLARKIRCAPVVDEERHLLGIVTETDLMKLLEHMVDA